MSKLKLVSELCLAFDVDVVPLTKAHSIGKLHGHIIMLQRRATLGVRCLNAFSSGLPARRSARGQAVKTFSLQPMPAQTYALVRNTTPVPCSSPADLWLKEAPRGEQRS